MSMRSLWSWYEYTLRRWLMLNEIGQELTKPWAWLTLWLLAMLVGFILWRRYRHLPPSTWSRVVRRYTVGVVLVGLLGVWLAVGSQQRAQEHKRSQRSQFVLGDDTPPRLPKVIETFPPAPEVPFSDELFQQLTRTPWLELQCPTDAPCERFDFQSDGLVRRGPAVPKAGQSEELKMGWDLRATTDQSGVIALVDGTLLPFALQGDTELRLDGRTFRRDLRPTPPRAAPLMKGSRPPPLSILQTFEELVSIPWFQRERELLLWGRSDYEGLPERVFFHPDGSFEATYQQGACVHRGTFKVKAGKLVPSWEGNPCATVEPRRHTHRNYYTPLGWLENGKLPLREVFYPANLLGEPGMFFIDPQNLGVTLKGQLSGKLQKGVPTPLAVALRCTTPGRAKKLRSLSLAMRELLPPEQQQVRKPRTQLLVSKDLGGRPLSAWKPLIEETVTLTPEFSGPVELRVVLAFEDAQPPHLLDRTYLLEVGGSP